MSESFPERVLVIHDEPKREYMLGLLADVLRKQGYIVDEVVVQRLNCLPEIQLMIKQEKE